MKKAYIQKAIAFINSEQELLCLKIRHPEQFRQAGEPTFKSDLHIIPKSKGLGIIALAEIVIALFLTKQVFQRNGKPAHLIQIADAFEKVFNCSFGSIYDQQEKVFDRKPFNRTKAIDFLRNHFDFIVLYLLLFSLLFSVHHAPGIVPGVLFPYIPEGL